MKTDTPKTYNGFPNYETWNVAMHINNKYYQYSIKANTYSEFLKLTEGIRENQTPDNIDWTDKNLDTERLDETIQENV